MSRTDESERRDPLAGVDEAGLDLVPGSEVIPNVLARPPKRQKRKNPLRPSERRRKKRMLTTTFSRPSIPRRVRALTEQWGMYTSAGHPNHSAVLEHLLLPRLEAAERGEILPPTEVE